MSKHSPAVRIRAFRIWQKLGFMPWSKRKEKSKKKDFYKGAFDSIPFLNNDAKRTFVHLLLRPGYMIRDYIKGQHERYLAPLTSLIVFYAFFALISSVVNPAYTTDSTYDTPSINASKDTVIVGDTAFPVHLDSLETDAKAAKARKKALGMLQLLNSLDLDRHPERVDTPAKASLAALENALRSKGIYLFLGQFLLLWIAMCFALRKKDMSMSACAATAAYVLCQFCFFMFFSLFLASNDKGEIGIGLMAVLLTIDYSQMFGVGWKKGFGLALKTGVFYGLTFLLLLIPVIGIIYLLI